MSVLPFDSTGQITDRDGNVLADIQCTVFKDNESPVAVGQQHFYQAFASFAATVAFGRQNLLLSTNGEEYRIADSTVYRYADYVLLTLRRVLPSG